MDWQSCDSKGLGHPTCNFEITSSRFQAKGLRKHIFLNLQFDIVGKVSIKLAITLIRD